MIQHGAGKIIGSKERYIRYSVCCIVAIIPILSWLGLHSLTVDDDIEKIIREGEERTAQLNKKYEGMNLDALTNFQPELDTRSWEGQTYTGFKVSSSCDVFIALQCTLIFVGNIQSGGPGWIDLGKRQAKEVSYAVDQYFSNAMKGNQAPKDDKPKIPKAPKQIDL